LIEHRDLAGVSFDSTVLLKKYSPVRAFEGAVIGPVTRRMELPPGWLASLMIRLP
jgi:hypothetical protein